MIKNDLRIVEESERGSAYELVRGTECHHLDFVTDGEDRHLPVALAMFAASLACNLAIAACRVLRAPRSRNVAARR